MRVLLVNLKLFYQCRVPWFLYLFIFFIACNLLFSAAESLGMHMFRGTTGEAEGMSFDWMGSICAISLVLGAIVAGVQMDVASKSFSFCLPEHRMVPRDVVLLLGLILSLLVLLLEFVKDSPTSLSAAYLSGVSFTAYFAGAGVGLVSRYGPVVVVATFVLLMGGSMLDFAESQKYVPSMASATLAILLGVVSALAIWLSLGRTSLFRHRCGKPWLGLSDLWNPAALEKYRWARLSAQARHAPAPRAGGFLIGAMRRCAHGSIAKYVWGALYTWLLPGGGGRSRIVSMGFWSVVSGVAAWYFPSMGPFFVANMSIYGGDVLRNSPVNSHLLVAGGRRERFFATTALITVLGTIVTCCLVLGAIAADLLGVHNPISEASRQYPESYVHAIVTQAMNLRLVVLFVALFPISRFLEVRFLGRRALGKITQGIVFFPAILLGQLALPWLALIPPVYVAFIFVLSWVAGIYGVHRTIMRSDLGRR